MTPPRKRRDDISRHEEIGTNSSTLQFASKKRSPSLEELYTPLPNHSRHPLSFLVTNGGLFRFSRRGQKKRKTKREEKNNLDLEGTGENRVEPREPVYEMKCKRTTEMQTRFIATMIDEAHERYLRNARPPEDVKRLLDSYVEALQEGIVNHVRQGE